MWVYLQTKNVAKCAFNSSMATGNLNMKCKCFVLIGYLCCHSLSFFLPCCTHQASIEAFTLCHFYSLNFFVVVVPELTMDHVQIYIYIWA